MMVMMLGGAGGADQEPRAVTDPTGWFSVGDLAPGQRYGLTFRRSGYVPATEGGIEVPRVEPLAIELRPASEVSGRVVDGRGEPVAGADVAMRRTQTIELGGRAMKTVMMESASSDAEGRFRYEDQPPGPIGLAVTASGFRETKLDHLEIVAGEDLDDLEIRLEPGAVVQGQVLAPDGRPVGDARIAPVTDTREPLVGLDVARTDGDGRYRLEGLAAGKVSIEASHDEHPRVVRDVELTEGVQTLDFTFEGGLRVTGTVVDTSGGPIAGASLRLAPVGRLFGGPEARSSADGSFALEGARDGEYELWADATGYAASNGKTRVTVAGEPVSGIEVRLDRGTAVVGQVTGVASDAMSRVRVRVEGAGSFGLSGAAVDHRGQYRIENVAPGSYRVVAERGDSGATAAAEVEVAEGTPEMRADLAFEPGLTLSGRVLQGSQPVDGAMLAIEGVDVDHSGWTDTGRDGSFRLEGLEPGRYRATVRDFATGLAHSETVDVAASREIVLRVPTARVAGIVTDGADRRPLAGVSLELAREGVELDGRLPALTAVSDSEGRFEIDGVAEGAWRLQARKSGYATASRAIGVERSGGPESVAIALDPTDGLTLETRLPSGAFPDAVRVAVLDASGHAIVGGTYATGEGGRVRLSTVPPGRWRAVVSAEGSAATAVDVVAPGPAVAVALSPATRLQVSVPELGSGGGLATLRVAAPDGAPFHELSWTGQPRAEWQVRNGRTEVVSLPPGTWRVTVAAADGRTWQGESTTSPASAAEVVLE
jgi:protocatechuate 3,4-dioxygenase beta subunit